MIYSYLSFVYLLNDIWAAWTSSLEQAISH